VRSPRVAVEGRAPQLWTIASRRAPQAMARYAALTSSRLQIGWRASSPTNMLRIDPMLKSQPLPRNRLGMPAFASNASPQQRLQRGCGPSIQRLEEVLDVIFRERLRSRAPGAEDRLGEMPLLTL
jgi:hypothetical protein